MKKIIILLISSFFIFANPIASYSTPIHYSVSGTGTEEGTNEISNLTGYMVISDEPSGNFNPPYHTDSSVNYSIETSILFLEGIGSNYGTGFIRFEWDGVSWGRAYLTGLSNNEPFHVGFNYSDGSPYNRNNLGEYTALAPLITLTGNTGHFGDNNQYMAYYNLTLSVPEPSSLLLVCIGLIGLVGFGWRRLNK